MEEALLTFTPLEFAYPSAAWRGKPFWSWNGKLEKAELNRQIQVLKEMGMGGYFMHSRTGLVTEYLGEEWFELTNACAEAGEALGMESWLYDEDRWPSGTAGGKVTANPAYQMKYIRMSMLEGESFDLAAWQAEQERQQHRPLGAWTCRIENRIDVYDLTPITSSTTSDDLAGKTVLAFAVEPMAKSSFYNGNTYVDTMKREATDEYIRLTHEAYKRHCGEHFGKGIRGIFTDEPHRGTFMSGKTPADAYLVPWTDTLFDTFAELHGGVKVQDHLPELFLRHEGREVSAIKAQYVETMQTLFLRNFAKPYYDWCDANGLAVTGHVLHENTLASQVSTHGSVQRYYPLMHVPGIDYLGEHERDYWVPKQIDSVARQFEQPWILSELYGCTGWQMNFESHRAVGAWQALFGVNLRCHHLSWYTMGGQAKRDYPASILHQSPWHHEYDTVETWFARLGYFRAQGEPCCDLLVLNPIESAWGRVYPGAIRWMTTIDSRIADLEKRYADCFHLLAGNQIDFDYGDEALLAEHASVSVEGGKPTLRLGAMTYTTVLITGVETMRSSTYKLLREFAEAGGRVLVAGDAPRYLDAMPTDVFKSHPFNSCPFTEEAMLVALQGHTPARVHIVDRHTGDRAREVFCQLRRDVEGVYLTVLNSNREQAIDVEITVEGLREELLEEWDLETGEGTLLPVDIRSGLTFSARFDTSQVRCYRMVRQTALRPTPAEEVTPEPTADAERLVLDQPVAYTLADRNLCVLDTPAWSFDTLDDGAPQPVHDILQVDRLVRQHLGVPVRGGDMVQPWFRGHETFPALGKLTLTYPLEVDAAAVPALDHAQLVVETPGRFSIAINGTPIDTTHDYGWWVDVALRRVPLPTKRFRAGRNEITVTCDFAEDLNLEAMYLLGDFAVSFDDGEHCLPRLTPLPERLAPTSIVEQGLPFYSGGITYHYDVPATWVGATARIEVPAYAGAYFKLETGGDSRLVPWRPNHADLTLGATLDVEVCITRKNTFGPLHLKNPAPAFCGPGAFVPGPEEFSLPHVFIDSGLLAPVRLLRV